MVLKLAIISLSVLELLAITDGSIRSDPVIIASIINCDPIGTWMRHRHRCICRPQFHGLRCNRIYRCVSGKPRNVSCSFPEIEHMATARTRCMHRDDDMIEVCECFDGYRGPLCEQTIQPKTASLIFLPRREPGMEFDPYFEEEAENEAYHDNEWSYWTPDNSHWIAFILLHLVLVIIALTSVTVALVCYLRRKKSSYRALNQLAKPSENSADDSCEKSSLPPNYDDIVHQVKVVNDVPKEAEGNSKRTALVINSDAKQLYLHV